MREAASSHPVRVTPSAEPRVEARRPHYALPRLRRSRPPGPVL